MCIVPLDGAPQMLDRIVVRRVARQRFHPQTLRMGGDKLSRLDRRVIAGSILDQDQRLRRLRQHLLQERTIALRVEAPHMSLGEQAPREIVDQAKYLVTLALASR